MTLVFQHPERIWLIAAALALAVFFVLRGYWRSPLRGWSRIAAPTCKLAAWLILALMLADPVWSRTQPKTGENEIAIAVDHSLSLDISEAAGQPTRAERIRAALGSGAAPPAWLDQLANQFRVKSQLIGERLQSVPDFQTLAFDGRQSQLAGALRTIRHDSPGSRLAAVVLITDGAATDRAAWDSRGRAPVFPILSADVAPTPDLALTDPVITQTSFEDTPVTIATGVASRGFAGREAAVLVADPAGKVLATEKVRLTNDSGTVPVRLRVPALKPGVSFCRLLVMDAALATKLAGDEWKKSAGEATLANNERLIAIDRGTGPYRVLYLAGRPNWEYKFLRRALLADQEMQLPSLIRIAKREPKFEWRGRGGETSNPLFRGFGQQAGAQRYDQPVLIRLGAKDASELADGFPKAPEELFGEYRAVVLDDVEAAFFSQEQMHLIERFVSERGGALLMLGGQESYQNGGYEHTPLGRLLPVYLDRIGQSAPISGGRFNLTREGWLEPWTRLRTSREEEEQRLATMPGFHAVNQLFSIKPGASVLATIGGDTQSGYPALVAQRFGEGRVAALTVGDMWRWGMKDATQHQDMDRTWRQLLRWLVVDVPDRIQLAAAPEDDRVRLAVRVRDRAFRPSDDVMVKVEITQEAQPGAAPPPPATLYAEPSLREAGLYEAEFFSRQPGFFRATATVQSISTSPGAAAETLGTKTTGWAYDPAAPEFADLAPGRVWLEQVAKETGGQVLQLADLPRLPDLLAKIRAPVEETITQPLWHEPWLFGLLLSLLVAEWAIRRRGGLA